MGTHHLRDVCQTAPMPRIIGGTARGRQITVPKSMRSRPTSDRAKEGLIGTLEDMAGLSNARVADFYAGTGSVGLEMLSRGAVHCLLVEADPRVADSIRSNAADIGLSGAEIVCAKAEDVATASPRGEPYDVIFLDPPYETHHGQINSVLSDLCQNGWLTSGGLLAVERATRTPEPVWPKSVQGKRARRYGDATIWYGRPQ